jgi:[acyl-carrier-protein] S-malonyltransferase
VLFPGQGSQTSDMRTRVERWCPELAEAAIDALGDDPFARAEESTAFAQPAIYCANVAGWIAVSEQARPAAVAGHSLGEFAALVAAGSVNRLAALHLVIARGRLMAEVERKEGTGGMVAVSGSDLALLIPLAERHGIAIANHNSPQQVVLSGPVDAVEEARLAAREAGLRAMRLPVGGAFHSPLMAGVVDEFAQLVEQVEFQPPRLQAICTTTAAPFGDVGAELVQGIVRPVLWHQSLERLRRDGVALMIEAGPGRVLARLAKRTYGEAVEVRAAEDVVPVGA